MGIKDRRTKILLALQILPSVQADDKKFPSLIFDEKIQKLLNLSMNQKTKSMLAGMVKEGVIEKTSQQSAVGNNQSVETHHDASAQSAVGSQPLSQLNQSNADSTDSTDSTDLTSYRLTNVGFSQLCFQFPFFRFLKEEWDGKWRIISYEIPESKREIRDHLRREMQGWGLGPWHRSFWLTPHPVFERLKELVVGKEEEKYIQAFSADHSFGQRAILIEKVWMIKELDKKYREMFKKWHDILASDVETNLDSPKNSKIEKFLQVISEYVTLLREDPGLPKQLIGEQWIGFEAYNIFKEIKSILLS